MTEFVVIRMSNDEQPVEWMLADSSGGRQSAVATGSLEQAALDIQDRAVLILVPAVEVLTTVVHMPVRSRSKIRAALPFAMEESLAQDVADLHFAVGERQDDGKLPVAVVARDALDNWLGQLSAAGIEPSSVIAEHQGLAKIPGTLSMLIDGETIMFNDGANDEFAMQEVKPSDVLVIADQLGEQQREDDQSGHLVVFCTAEDDSKHAHDWIALRHEMHSVDVNVLPDTVMPKLAATVAAGHGINLLQGDYGKRTEYAAIFRPWKTAALLLLALGILAFGLKGADFLRLQDEVAVAQSEFTREYRSIRPDDTREIVDPRATVDSLKRAMGASAGPEVFLPGMREISVALAAQSDVQVEAISYRAGVLDLRLIAPDVSTLDRIQKAVSASGRFAATIQSTDQVADKTNGRIQVRESN